MKILIRDEQELVNVAEEAIKIIANLRRFTKYWEETHGVEMKNRKKRWEAIADKFIERLQLQGELKQNENIKIEVNEIR